MTAADSQASSGETILEWAPKLFLPLCKADQNRPTSSDTSEVKNRGETGSYLLIIYDTAVSAVHSNPNRPQTPAG